MTDAEGFARRLFSALLERAYRIEPGAGSGWDLSREWEESPARRARDAVVAAAARAGFARRRFDVEEGAAALARLAGDLEGLARTDAVLADERSRSLLVDVLAFRVLGPSHVRLPITNREFERRAAELDGATRTGGETVESPYGERLARRRVGAVDLYTHPMSALFFFELEQYAYRRGGVEIAAAPGDVVVDAGAGWGETPLYFAEAVGEGGRVVCFEFEPASLGLLRRNLEANPRLAGRVRVVKRALWRASGERVPYAPAGLSSAVGTGDAAVDTESVDALGLDRLDFLKLDVEGAELDALRGAEETIRRDRPGLAVAVYHRDADLAEIPAWIDDLGLGYRLYLDHFSPGWSETILFAAAR